VGWSLVKLPKSFTTVHAFDIGFPINFQLYFEIKGRSDWERELNQAGPTRRIRAFHVFDGQRQKA
jgi:hypothetical protein